MNYYHIWCDLKEGVKDLAFSANLNGYLGHLKDSGLIAGFQLTRRKLGLGPDHLREFHIIISIHDLSQLDAVFGEVAKRQGETETLHAKVYSAVKNTQFALYRDFPDAVREA